MIRFTTVPMTYTIEGYDLRNSNVLFSIVQEIGHSKNFHKVVIGGNRVSVSYDGENSAVTVTPTQEESGGFVPGKAKVQINWVKSGDERTATLEGEIPVYENHIQEEIAYA